MIRARQFLPLLSLSLGFVRGEAAAFISHSNCKSDLVRALDSRTATARAFTAGPKSFNPKMAEVDEEQRAFNQAWSEARHRQRSVDNPEQEFATASDNIPSLATLPMVALTDVNVSAVAMPDHVQFSAFAIYDETKDLQYVGATRDLRHTLRALSACLPGKASFAKIFHIERKGRTFMDLVVDWWLAEAVAESGVPPGNEGGDDADRWRKAMDVSDTEYELIKALSPQQ